MSNCTNCNYCGHFMSYDEHDEYTNFGSCEDMEEPDAVYVCRKCALKEKKRMIESGMVAHPWRLAKYMREAAEELGLVEAGPKGAAWANFFKPDEVPEGYEVWEKVEISNE